MTGNIFNWFPYEDESMPMKPIPQEWIEKYIDELIKAAHMFGGDTAMGKAAADRANAIMDMVQAFRDKPDYTETKEPPLEGPIAW